MNGKDMKAPPDYDGSRKNFASWHESFISMLTCKTPKWQIILDWLKSRKEQKIHTGTALAEFREYAKQYGIKDTPWRRTSTNTKNSYTDIYLIIPKTNNAWT